MSSSQGQKRPSKEGKRSLLKVFFTKLRKRLIIEALAAFMGGRRLLLEVVGRLLVVHYRFPEETIDLSRSEI